MAVTEATVNEWVRKIRLLAETQLIPEGVDRSGACVYYAGAAHAFLSNLFPNLRVEIEAGSMSWPMIDRMLDDGKMATHFTYQFENPRTVAECKLFGLPEVHVWVAVYAKEKFLVDVTTRYLKEQQKRLYPEGEWTGADPFDFVWHEQALLEKIGVHYTNDDRAVMMALDILLDTKIRDAKAGAV